MSYSHPLSISVNDVMGICRERPCQFISNMMYDLTKRMPLAETVTFSKKLHLLTSTRGDTLRGKG